ncbi:hypothetical protein AKJ16_DCAP25180 [Drosera capensis]
MVIIDEVHERLHSRLLRRLLRRVLSDHLLRVLRDPDDETLAVAAVVGAVVEGFDDIHAHHILHIHIHRVPRSHDMVIIDEVHERLHSRLLRRLLRRVLSDHLLRVLRDPDDETLAVAAVVGAVVEGFDDALLLSGDNKSIFNLETT